MAINIKIEGKKAIIKTDGRICETTEELIGSEPFKNFLTKFIAFSREKNYTIIDLIDQKIKSSESVNFLSCVLKYLCYHNTEETLKLFPRCDFLIVDKALLGKLVEDLYDYWRNYERYLICRSTIGQEEMPYRTFKETTEKLTHLVRAAYRDIQENISGEHPKIYRQVHAGINFGVITTVDKSIRYPKYYQKISNIPMIRQVLLNPPIIIDPPTNKRTGEFKRVNRNIFANQKLDKNEWLCYPALVGTMLIHVYFHHSFMELGLSLSNLFELSGSGVNGSKPDAIVFYGLPSYSFDTESSTVFFDDEENDVLVGAIPIGKEFGYFGYLKKIVLTLHNVAMMKKNKMPFHGALFRIIFNNGKTATILIIGDTGTGKSESLEAFRVLGDKLIKEIITIADDMGSLDIDQLGNILGYGTEIGAFVRLDDLDKGYAYGRMDRAIFMSPQKTNSRVVIPATTINEIQRGYPIDYMLYANNYQEVSKKHPIIEKINKANNALEIFSNGLAMSKGTTTATGITDSYFANPFGPPEYQELHEKIAQRFFQKAYEKEIFVGQIRTRLGVPGWETNGPVEAATALLELIYKK